MPRTSSARASPTASLRGPFKDQVERDLESTETYLTGLEELFKKYKLAGYEEPFGKLREQVKAYNGFVRREILPRARTDFRQPAELYAFGLKQYGVDMPVEELVSRAEVSFKEIQNEMQALAPLVAKEKGLQATDYRAVLRELKKNADHGRGDPAPLPGAHQIAGRDHPPRKDRQPAGAADEGACWRARPRACRSRRRTCGRRA